MNTLPLSRSPTLLAFLLALAGLPTKADTSFTTTGWLRAAPLAGITVSNHSGQVYLKGNAHVVRFQSDDYRVTGRLEAWMDLAYEPDGTCVFSGPAYFEVGAWDATGTNFVASGGVWALNYSGVIQTDGSTCYSLAGYGIGGNIEGLRICGTATRSNADPATPYMGSGTIKAAPLNVQSVVDNFDNNHFDTATWGSSGAGSGSLHLYETNQQLTIVGTWQTPTASVQDYTAWISPTSRGWSVAAGRTLELHAGLAQLSPAGAAAAGLGLYNSPGLGFGLTKSSDWLCLWKQIGSTLVIGTAVRETTTDNNVELVFAVTPVGSNVLLTGKVLDNNGAVLGQVSWMDTPGKDASLTASQVTNLIGGPLWRDVGPDAALTPWKSGNSVFLAVFQNSDGTALSSQATYDNIELRTREVPQVAVERALLVSWPDTGVNFSLERTSNLNSNIDACAWLPVQNLESPGLRYVTVPMGATQEFFRLQEAP
jgi:hypothetical protein